MFEVCGEKLPIQREPSCEDFYQLVRLVGVKGFEHERPDPKRPVEKSPVIAAAARPAHLRSFVASRLLATPQPVPRPRGGAKSESKKGKSAAARKKSGAASLAAASGPFGDSIEHAIESAVEEIEKAVAAARAAYEGALHRGQPVCRDVQLGLVLRYQQCWTPCGYVRGELLNSLSLAPGEELRLEFFTWDRHRIERERERESSQESAESGTVTSRISSEVVANLQFKVQAGANAKVGGSLSLAELELPIDVNGEVGANFSTELSSGLTTTTSRLNEATRTASNTVRNSQKTRIVEASEFGSENRSIRRIQNENRCHTVSYDYFEILAQYAVTTQIREALFVAMVPLPSAGVLSREFLLCNEYPLRRQLLDPVYEAGFEAAKRLRAAEIYRRSVALPAPGTQPGAASDDDADTLAVELRLLLDSIVDASDRLRGIAFTAADWADAFSLNPSRIERAYRKACKIATRMYVLSVYTGLFDRIDELEGFRNASGRQLFTHFDIFLDQMLSAGVMNIIARPVKWEAYSVLALGYDDEGLIGAIQTAARRVEDLRPSLNAQTAAEATLPQTSDAAPSPESPTLSPIEAMVDREFGLKNLAEDQVEVDRLLCHIEEHQRHYLTILFLHDGVDAASKILSFCPQVAGLVEPRILSIQDGYAIFPLTASEQRRRGHERLEALIEATRDNERTTEPFCVRLATPGTVLEARLGECNACEPFIVKHREYDLELKAEEVDQARERTRQDAAEAARLEGRLAQSPPLLDDPTPADPVIRVSVEKPDTD